MGEVDPPSRRLANLSGVLGVGFLAIAVVLHIDHLAYRVGRSAVVLVIAGTALMTAANLAFVVSPALSNQVSWLNLSDVLWGLAFGAFGLGLAAVAIHKEKQIERGLVQLEDIGDSDTADITVHASLFSLISASVGAILYAIGEFGQIGYASGTREAWVLQVLGMILIAVGIICHVEHLGRHIGNGAVA